MSFYIDNEGRGDLEAIYQQEHNTTNHYDKLPLSPVMDPFAWFHDNHTNETTQQQQDNTNQFNMTINVDQFNLRDQPIDDSEETSASGSPASTASSSSMTTSGASSPTESHNSNDSSILDQFEVIIPAEISSNTISATIATPNTTNAPANRKRTRAAETQISKNKKRCSSKLSLSTMGSNTNKKSVCGMSTSSSATSLTALLVDSSPQHSSVSSPQTTVMLNSRSTSLSASPAPTISTVHSPATSMTINKLLINMNHNATKNDTNDLCAAFVAFQSVYRKRIEQQQRNLNAIQSMLTEEQMKRYLEFVNNQHKKMI